MYNGIINIYKEAGFTSHDVVAKLRGILKQKKIGHTGTLDPDATGVLPVCLGNGTKLSDMLTDTDKTYDAAILLGRTTDTQDISGSVISISDVNVTEEETVLAIKSFIGPYMQIPPMYSAVKQNGKKLYELARAGIEVKREPRNVIIYDIDIKKIAFPYVYITVYCSKGTYIRTLCHDIGQALGCGACMSSLVRTKAGIFKIDDSITLDDVIRLNEAGIINEKIIPPDKMFPKAGKCIMTKEGDRLVHNGNPFTESDAEQGYDIPKNAPVLVYDSDGVFIGVFSYREKSGSFFPDKMFYNPLS